ncbi:hypothetical protein ACIG47_13360 [Promicromonospora sp. NPDC052451]|uniref:hypothetical protein n=1 Tax=Promicromonospora sp. NPDC052451 TaxID=3364407 RepID=UPI0037C7F1D0
MSGEDALHGFRYQVLRTVERVLEIYESSPDGNWAVEVESTTDEKVDYAEWHEGEVTRVVQVKASMPDASTRIRARQVDEILAHLATRFPAAREVVLESNRNGDWEAIQSVEGSTSGPRRTAWRDSRTLGQLEQAVTDRIRELRLAISRSGDPLTNRYLAFILESMVWKRGAGPSARAGDSKFLRGADVSDLLAIAGQDVAALLGEVPWGRSWRVPGGSRVPRPEIFAWLHLQLPASALYTVGAPARAALAGFSGAGKTSAAAVWAEENLERYALVFWVPARTEEELADAVRSLLEAEHGDTVQDWGISTVREKFTDLLVRTPLAWLLVFDNASSPEVVREWIPARGFGHVLITTRDSTWSPSAAPSLEVAAMDRTTARTLVERRLGREVEDLQAFDALIRLTDGWPLAVEMVTGWLVRSGRQLSGVSEYARQRTDLLDRKVLVPEGYPQTVVSAVVNALADIQAADSNVAWHILLTVGRLGSKSVPVPLLRQLAQNQTSDAADQIDDAISDLRSHSLIRREDLGINELNEWSDQVSINDLIGDIALRVADEDLSEDYDTVESLALVLREALETRDFRLASSFSAMVASLERQERFGWRLPSLPLLTVYGNMATVFQHRGDYVQAESLLLREARLAEAVALSPEIPEEVDAQVAILMFKTWVQLANLSLHNDRPDRTIVAAAMAVPFVKAFVSHLPEELWRQSVDSIVEALRGIQNDNLTEHRDGLLEEILSTGVEIVPGAAQLAELALREGDNASARRVALEALESESDPLQRVQLYSAIAEADAADPARAQASLALATKEADRIGSGHEVITEAVLRIATTRWAEILREGTEWVTGDRRKFQESFIDLLPYLPVADPDETPWGAGTRAQLIRAWHAVVTESSASRSEIDRLLARFDTDEIYVATSEVESLKATAFQASAAEFRSNLPRVVDADFVGRSGNTILLAIDPHDFALVRAVGVIRDVEVATISWHVVLTVHGEAGQISVWADILRLPANPFARVHEEVALVVVGDSMPKIDEPTALVLNNVIDVGPVRISFEPWVKGVLAKNGVA